MGSMDLAKLGIVDFTKKARKPLPKQGQLAAKVKSVGEPEKDNWRAPPKKKGEEFPERSVEGTVRVGLPVDLVMDLDERQVALGYGPRERDKLLAAAVLVMRALPDLFRKR